MTLNIGPSAEKLMSTPTMDGKPLLRLIQDDDGHWYCIRVDEEAEFEKWVAWVGDGYSNEGDPPQNPKPDKMFDDNRIDGPHVVGFTEWRTW